MARAGGWYRRDTQLRLAVVGLLMAALLNINPLVIAPRLWNDPVLRATVTGVAVEAGKAYTAAASAVPGASGGASAPAAAETSTMLAMVTQLAQAAAKPNGAQRAAAAPSAPAASATRIELPQSREVEQAMSALKESLFSAAAATRVHSDFGTAQRIQAAIDLLLDTQDQVQARRAARDQAGYPRAVFDSSAIIERHLDSLEAQFDGAGAKHDATALAMLARLRTALQDERDALLPASAGQTRPPGDRACVTSDDEATRTLCQQLDGLQALAGVGLPIGWAWANWPGCDGACQARHRPKDPAASEASKDDAYAQALTASPAASAVDLKTKYYDARKKLFAEANDASGSRWKMPALTDADVWPAAIFAVGGWLILALAATLGAPFWFDLLGRLVKLRGSGTSSGSTDSDAPTPPKGDGGSPSGTLTAQPSPPAAPPGGAAGPDSGALNPAELDLGSAQITRLQNALGMTGADATGRFDSNTRNKIAAWQMDRRENGTGQLTAAQIQILLPPPSPPAVAPPSARPDARGRTPVRTDGTVNVLSDQDVRALYGNIGTVPDPANPNLVEIRTKGLPGQAQWELAPFSHALLPPAAGQLKVHVRALKHFQAVFDAIQQKNLGDRIKTCAGTYCARHIGNDNTKPLSRHTWAIAIDLNAEQNGYGQAPAPKGAEGSVVELVPIFEHFGFAWGGNFTTGKDGMHFELALRDPDQDPLPLT
ncbi:MAG: M15 family metallopeptidase [Proteobacteria bacterium]|nr:M15 family metallopeptidase [Pseudomonadota bacterium]